VKLYKTLRNLLVHPKCKLQLSRQVSACTRLHTCSSTYTGETGRSYGKRQEEHRKEVESISNKTLTWAEWKELATKTNKSAITDHVAKKNHVINWSSAKILDRESHQKTQKLKECIYIHKEVNCMNRDKEPTTYL